MRFRCFSSDVFTDICCLKVATDQDFKQTYNTLKTEVEIEIEATTKSKLESRSKPQIETEIEIETEIDY